jgi:hypothetical protein
MLLVCQIVDGALIVKGKVETFLEVEALLRDLRLHGWDTMGDFIVLRIEMP